MDHDAIHQEAERLFDQWYPHVGKENGCLYWMHCGLAVLTKHGIRCTPQCGSAYWRIVPDEMDDGVRSLFFGFSWKADPKLTGQVIRKLEVSKTSEALPEMHCWIGLPDTQEVVDFSVGTMPVIAARMGFKWEMPPPPPYIWARMDSMPCGAVYQPDMDATLLAVAIIASGQ